MYRAKKTHEPPETIAVNVYLQNEEKLKIKRGRGEVPREAHRKL